MCPETSYHESQYSTDYKHDIPAHQCQISHAYVFVCVCSHYLDRNIAAAGKLPAGPAPPEGPAPPATVATGANGGPASGGAATASGSAASTTTGTGAATEKFAPPTTAPARKLMEGGFNPDDPAFQESNLMHGMNGFVYGNMPVRASYWLHGRQTMLMFARSCVWHCALY